MKCPWHSRKGKAPPGARAGNQWLQPHESRKQIPGCLARSDTDAIMEKGEKENLTLKSQIKCKNRFWWWLRENKNKTKETQK